MYKQLKKINNSEYEYLEHSFRIGEKVKKFSISLPKRKKIDIKKLFERNQKKIGEISLLISENIRKTKKYSKFFNYGSIIESIELRRVKFQILLGLVDERDRKEILSEYLRTFLVNSMEMDGGTISYEVAIAIEEKKKFRLDGIQKLDIPLYQQLQKAFNTLDNIKLRYPKNIKDLHLEVYKGIYPFAGKYRSKKVTFGDAQNLAITSDKESIIKDYRKALNKLHKGRAKVYNFERIIEFHKDCQAVHGFEDGNSRLGRLITANQLIKLGYPPMIIKGNQSKGYKLSLVRAINKKDNTSLANFFYTSYIRTFDKFWLPILQEKI